MDQFGIYQDNGLLIQDSIRETRKQARRDFAAEHGTKWGHLWDLGYRVREVKPAAFRRPGITKRAASAEA